MPKHALTDEEIARCFDVMSELRTHLKRHSFVELVRHMETEGYRLAYMEEQNEIVTVAGYRIFTNLFIGKGLYVDDLVTSAHCRSRGHGEAMIGWLRAIAQENRCAYIHLDSGTQRHEAHRFYFRQGFFIGSFHFSEHLSAT